MKYEIEAGDRVAEVASGLIRAAAAAQDPLAFMAVTALGGDRHVCCDEVVVAYDDDVLVGAATIAPKGESGAEMPEIVGLFVLESHRRRGVGRELVLRAVEHCRERGLVPVRVNLLSKAASALFKTLPPTVIADLRIRDQSHLLPF